MSYNISCLPEGFSYDPSTHSIHNPYTKKNDAIYNVDNGTVKTKKLTFLSVDEYVQMQIAVFKNPSKVSQRDMISEYFTSDTTVINLCGHDCIVSKRCVKLFFLCLTGLIVTTVIVVPICIYLL